LKQDLSKEVILNYDPLPPEDAVNIYTHGEHLLSQASGSQQQQAPEGFLSSLFRSFVFDLNAEGRNNNNNQQLGLHV
jgi:hypothetical protein